MAEIKGKSETLCCYLMSLYRTVANLRVGNGLGATD